MVTQEINEVTVLKTEELLREIIASPEGFRDNEQLLLALNSQGKLAKYSDESKKIATCALNTMKTIADKLLDRGFVELNELRTSAKDCILEAGAEKTENEKTKAGVIRKSKRLESELNNTRRNNFMLSLIIKEQRTKMKQIAESDDSKDLRIETYKDADRKIELQLSYTLRGEEVVCEKCEERSKSQRS
tara:strand:+ start:2723 stop:3289 length:567 start_codon:yes stop_codon:yes gene_type:complete